jgi:hypothetical protein
MLVTIAGALVVVAAGVTVGMASAELNTERIIVTAQTPRGPGFQLPATPGADPFTTHPSAGMAAPRGMRQGAGQEALTPSDPHDAMKNGSFLGALLSIAAVALCVALPVMGIGVFFAVAGFGRLKGPRKHRRPSSRVSVGHRLS